MGRRLGSRSARAPHAARAVIGIAAALVLFMVGVSVGSRTAPAVAPSPEGVGGRYLLVLYEDDSFRPDRPIEELVAEYGAWASSSWPNGSVATGEQLGEGGWLLEGEGGEASALASGPLGDVTGYFVITATEDSAAREIAASCPHLRYGGRVALQPIAGP